MTRAHGTLARYHVDKCRCELCCARKSSYHTGRTRQIAYGRWQPYAAPESARAHVAYLIGYGLSINTIADMAGVDHECVSDLMSDAHERGLLPASAEALLSVRFDLDLVPGRSFIDAAGTRRRVQALATLGHSVKSQATALGRLANNFNDVVTQVRVFAYTARQVRDLYDEWSSNPPPDTHGAKVARTLAARKKWLPPAAWDDDWIDLTDAALEIELRRQAELMGDVEVRRCYDAFRKKGERSPLVVAAAREYDRRLYRKQVAFA
ncbi:hypothetical protein [Streptosporangium sp. NPDC051022]|uniref:hypothetical protein n=1 Tax=Streptosporangium sp. NPDC051022 TaxID=3155752 RepID=UPI003440AA67